jgi:hypothetical protein
MEVTMALLADAANISREGKLNVLGVFQTMNSSEVPFNYSKFVLVLSLRASPGEKGMQKSLIVRLITEDGKPLGDLINAGLGVPADAPELNPELNLMVDVAGLHIPRFGKYTIEVLVNGEPKKQLELNVLPRAVPQLPQQGLEPPAA